MSSHSLASTTSDESSNAESDRSDPDTGSERETDTGSESDSAETDNAGQELQANTPRPHCHVEQCRFKWTHVTSGHRCGLCGQYGHGRIECGNAMRRNELAVTWGPNYLPPELQCTLPGCRYARSHTSQAHHCNVCAGRGHSAVTCPNREHLLAAPAVASSAGSSSLPYSMSLPSSSSSSTISAVDAGTNLQVECPVCRTPNTLSTLQPTTYNVNTDCVVCCDSEAQVYLPKCGHVCLCWNCAKDLHK